MISICIKSRSQLMLPLSIWALLLLYSRAYSSNYGSGRATAGLRSGATESYSFFANRGLKDTWKEDWGGDRNNRKKDEMVKEIEQPTEQPTQYSTHSPSQSPTIEQLAEMRLLPFSILIHGSLSMEDEFDIRNKLQKYLLESFLGIQEQKVGVTTNSVVLEMVQMVESYIPRDDGGDKGDSETNVGQSNRKRSLPYIFRLNGNQRKRSLQSSSSTSTSTLVKYQASAIFRLEKQQEEFPTDEMLPALQEKQIEVLENTVDLQEYFLKWFSMKQIADSAVNSYDEDSEYHITPVVLMSVQVAERPSEKLNVKETWKTIELMLDSSSSVSDSSSNVDTSDPSSHNENTNNTSENKLNKDSQSPNQSEAFSETTKRKFNRLIAVSIGCVVMMLLGLSGIYFVCRKRKNQYNRKFAGGDNAIEVTIENAVSDDYEVSIVKQQNDGNNNGTTDCIYGNSINNINIESSEIENPTISNFVEADENDSALPETDKANNLLCKTDGSLSKNSSFPFSRISFFQNSFKDKKQQKEMDRLQHDDENDELDSVAANIKLCNVVLNDDDDSMMGYSLTSLNRDRNNDEGLQDASNDIEDIDSISVVSSESGACNPVFAGIHKILEYKKHSKNFVQHTAEMALDGKSRFKDQKNQSRNLLEGDTSDNDRGDCILVSDTFETEDSRQSSTCTTCGPTKGDAPAIVMNASNRMDTDALPYYGQDEIMMTPSDRTSLLVEKSPSASPITSSSMVGNVADDASDAPSDERKNGGSTAVPSQYGVNRTRYPDSARYSKILDNDPAILEYLMNNERGINDRMMGPEPRMTMEL